MTPLAPTSGNKLVSGAAVSSNYNEFGNLRAPSGGGLGGGGAAPSMTGPSLSTGGPVSAGTGRSAPTPQSIQTVSHQGSAPTSDIQAPADPIARVRAQSNAPTTNVNESVAAPLTGVASTLNTATGGLLQFGKNLSNGIQGNEAATPVGVDGKSKK